MLPQYTYSCKLVRLVDSDTFVMDIDVGFDIHTEKTVRLARLDAPEKKTPEGKKAINEVSTILNVAKLITIKSIKWEKYGRCLAEVWCDGKNLNDYLLNNNLAVPYSGGKRENSPQEGKQAEGQKTA